MSAARELAKAVRIECGQVLRELRNDRHMSQEALAEALDCDRTYPSLVERGLRQPTLAMLLGFARGLDVDPREIVGRVAERLKLEGWPAPDRSPGGTGK